MILADIYINLPIKSITQVYTYIVPEHLSDIEPGYRVIVPFGKSLREGFVIEIHNSEDRSDIELQRLKEINCAIDKEPWFNPQMYELATWMSRYYLCSNAESMRLFIPGKSSIKLIPQYCVNANLNLEAFNQERLKLESPESQLFEYIYEHTAIDNTDLYKAFQATTREERLELQANLQKLLQRGLVLKNYTYKTKSTIQYMKYIHATTDLNPEVQAYLQRRPAQLRILKYIIEHQDIPWNRLQTETKCSTAILNALLDAGYITISKHQIYRDSYKNYGITKDIKRILTPIQQQVMDTIAQKLQQHKSKFLLHGITGSGKTQIYIEQAKLVRQQNRQVLILVPEIVLTGQLVLSFKEYFGVDVAVIHSQLSIGERHDTFMRIRMNRVGIIIGARSAIFAPFADLGLIVMDEEHDPSYKQDESPRYHAHDLVEKMIEIYGAYLICGSATPALETYYKAQQGEYVLLEMLERVSQQPLPRMVCVDMREELHLGNRKILSHELHRLILKNLNQQQQLILMLNRRGFSTFVMCRNCGYVVQCNECQLPMVYHKNGLMQCHHCDIRMRPPTICPECNSKYIKFFGSGTEKLELELQQLFPQARIVRLDRDTTRQKFAHQRIIEAFKRREYDIMLGTQMVAKGHDIPAVTGVGIISADSTLNMPDFRAGERTFALITQTAGRAGRGNIPGEVVVQSYNPKHYAVTHALKQDYHGFYEEELPLRQLMGFPPFSNLVKLTIQDVEEAQALHRAKTIATAAKDFFTDGSTTVMGPAPSIMPKLHDMFRYNLLLKSTNLKYTREFLRSLHLDIDKSVIIDVNPLNTN